MDTKREKRRVLYNVYSLSVLNGVNYLLPLLTLPYIVRVLGVELFGLTIFATAIVGYIRIVVAYGFDLSATREISLCRDDHMKIAEIFSAVIIVKSLFAIVSLLVLAVVVFSVEKLSQHWELFFLTYSIIVGEVLFPVWLFLGVERMIYITFLNVVSKLFFTITIFVFVKSPSDYLLVPALTSLGVLLIGIGSQYIVRRKFNIYFKLQPRRVLVEQMVNSWHIFLSNISTSAYTITVIFFLGVFTNNTITGYYAVADKLIGALKSLISPVAQALYPYLSRKSAESKMATLNIIRKLCVLFCIPSLVICILVFLYSNEIIILFFGSEFRESAVILRYFAFIPLLVVIDTFLGTLTMLVFDRKKKYSKIVLSGSALSLILATLLIPNFQHIGAVWTVLIVEIFITLQIVFYVQTSDLKLFGLKHE